MPKYQREATPTAGGEFLAGCMATCEDILRKARDKTKSNQERLRDIKQFCLRVLNRTHIIETDIETDEEETEEANT